MTRRRSVLAMSALGLLPPALMLGSALNTRARARDNFDRQFENVNNKARRVDVLVADLRISRERIWELTEQLKELKDVNRECQESKAFCKKITRALESKSQALTKKVEELQRQAQIPKKVGASEPFEIEELQRRLEMYEKRNKEIAQKHTQLERARRDIDTELKKSKLDVVRVRTSLSQEKKNNESLRREVTRLQRINELFQKSSSRNIAKARGRVVLANWKNLVTRNKLTKQIVDLKNDIIEKNKEIGRRTGLAEKVTELSKKLGLSKKLTKQITEKEFEKRNAAASAHAGRLTEVRNELQKVVENKNKLIGDLTGQVGKANEEKVNLEAKVAQMAAAELNNEEMLENARRKAMVHTQIVMDAFMTQKLKEQFKIIAKAKKAKDVGVILKEIISSEAKEPAIVESAKHDIIEHVSQKAKVVNSAAVKIINQTYGTYSRMNPSMRKLINLGLLTLAGIVGYGGVDRGEAEDGYDYLGPRGSRDYLGAGDYLGE